MAALEDLKPNSSVRGVLPNAIVTVVSVQWFGTGAVELTYKDPTGKVGNELIYRDRERCRVALRDHPENPIGKQLKAVTADRPPRPIDGELKAPWALEAVSDNTAADMLTTLAIGDAAS